MRDREKQQLKVATVLKTLLGLVVAAVVCGGAFIGGSIMNMMYGMTDSASAHMLKQTSFQSNAPEVPDSLPDDFYVLLLGVDSSESRQNGDEAKLYGGTFRSDSIIVAHVGLSDKKVSMCSIERDIKTEIDGYDGYNKINAAYALGGVDLMKAEAEKLMEVEIPYYAVIDMDGLTELIDAFGGVEVDVEKAFFDNQLQDGIDQAGVQLLNGQQAVMYSRSRHAWAEGDFARARHQRDVLKSLAGKIMGDANLFSLYNAAGIVSERVATNFTLPQIFETAAKLKDMNTSEDIYSMMTPTVSDNDPRVSYQIIDEDKWAEMLRVFHNLENPKGDPVYIEDVRVQDADMDGYLDADADIDGVVTDEELQAFIAEKDLNVSDDPKWSKAAQEEAAAASGDTTGRADSDYNELTKGSSSAQTNKTVSLEE